MDGISPSPILLSIEDLVTRFKKNGKYMHAVDHVSLTVRERETVGIVGESGCGKSVLSLSILRLIPNPPGEIIHGKIFFEGQDLLQLHEKEMAKLRGNKISIIFQDPMSSLNPLMSVGHQIAEVFSTHNKGLSHRKAQDQALEMLSLVRIPAPKQRYHDYPHQLSGGMRQRVMIAIGLAGAPRLLIADEPTTALDVTIQAQILDLIKMIKDQLHMAVMLITHDLGVVAETCDRVIVMYAGTIVEELSVLDLFQNPLHPYTKGLLNSIPKLGQKKTRLHTIPGNVPSLFDLPQGCRFKTRCIYAKDICQTKEPPLLPVAANQNRRVACFLAQK